MFLRSRTLKQLGIASGLVLSFWTSSRGARAQTEEEARAAARLLGIEGIRLAKDGHCDQAIDKLDRANRLFHAPTIVVQLAECQILMGQLVEGTEKLNGVVREDLGPNPSPAYVQAQARARQLLEATLPRIATLTVDVKAPAGATVELAVDGRPVSDALIGVARPIDPGKHSLVARVEGYEPASASVELAEAAREQVQLVIQQPSAATPPDAGPGAAPSAASGASRPGHLGTPEPQPSAGNQRTWGWISVGVGGVGLLGGSYFGLAALHDKSTLKDACTGGRCPPSQRSTIDSMNSEALLSTVGFAVGVVGVGLGGYLLLSADGADPSKSEAAPSTALSIHPYVGPSSAGVLGSF